MSESTDPNDRPTLPPTPPPPPLYPPAPPVAPAPSATARVSAHARGFIQSLNALPTSAKVIAAVMVLVLSCCSCGVGSVFGSHGGQAAPIAAQSTATPAATTAPTATPRPTATPKPKAWVTVQHFTGTNNQQTPTFNIPDGARIVWSAKATDQYGGNFIITMYNSDGSENDLIANTITPPDQSGTYNVHGDQTVYLAIETSSTSYDIAVQVYQ